jgi:hypothetical protein
MLQFEEDLFQELLGDTLAPGDLGNHKAAPFGLRKSDKGA